MRVSWRDLLVVAVPTLLAVALLFAFVVRFIQPAPPKSIVMASGTDGSIFRNYAERYRKILARSGVDLQIVSSGGSLDNLKRLSDPKQNIDVGFVQSGLPADSHAGELMSLGSMFYEPLFVLYRSPKPIARLSELTGKRLAVGQEGSGAEALALDLLKANGIEGGGRTALLTIGDDEAVKALLERRVDAVFLAGDSARPDEIRRLLHTPGVRLFDFVQADAYLRKFRYLSRIDLPMGVLDLGQNLPAHAATLVGPTVELIAHKDLHPALSDLLIEAAQEVHGRGSTLQRAGEFPSPVERDFPLSEGAARFYKSGKGFAYRHLPFWLASLVERTAVLVVPLLVMLPALRMIPTMYGWRIRARIFRRYAQLMALERESQRLPEPEQTERMLRRLDQIEAAVISLKLPARYADEAYVLRQHIDFVRARLGGIGAKPEPAPSISRMN